MAGRASVSRRDEGRRAEPPDVVDGPEDHHRLLDADEQGSRGPRGVGALRHRASIASTSSCTPSRSCTRWSSTSTARSSPSSRAPTCDCRSRTASDCPCVSTTAGARSISRSAIELTFEAPDPDAFPALGLAYEAARRGGAAPAWLSAANEVAVEAFLADRLAWATSCRRGAVMDDYVDDPLDSSTSLVANDAHARRRATESSAVR